MPLKIIIVIAIFASCLKTAAQKEINELRVGAGLPFTFIVSTPGVIQLSVNAEYSRKYGEFYPLLNLLSSSNKFSITCRRSILFLICFLILIILNLVLLQYLSTDVLIGRSTAVDLHLYL